MRRLLSIQRLIAVMAKEFVQMRRDPATMAMMVGIPLIQLILFGYAINSDPKHLPLAVRLNENSVFSRSLLQAMDNTRYFKVVGLTSSEKQGQQWIKEGRVLFVLNIPDNFSRDLIRGRSPHLLLQADATDPAATSNAVASLSQLASQSLSLNLQGSLSYLKAKPPPFNIDVHAMYNPLRITQYNIVPGLLGVVLTMTMVMITALTITRERERGTMENLLAMPTRPLEVMLGKLCPYVLSGFIQVLLILFASHFIFAVPMKGSVLLLMALCVPFIAANLAVGLTFSTVAENQLQAMQATMFFFLPSILLSGFMFPFKGMPEWAQFIGNLLPLTHFLRIVRGILLKGNGFIDSWDEVWPICVFFVVALIIGLMRYKQTLD